MTDYTQALCVGQDPELWFAQPGREREHAIKTCKECPIRLKCLEDVLAAESVGDTQYLFGIYAGLSGNQRSKLIKPKCQRCRTADRQWRSRYCKPCVRLAQREAHHRYDIERPYAS